MSKVAVLFDIYVPRGGGGDGGAAAAVLERPEHQLLGRVVAPSSKHVPRLVRREAAIASGLCGKKQAVGELRVDGQNCVRGMCEDGRTAAATL